MAARFQRFSQVFSFNVLVMLKKLESPFDRVLLFGGFMDFILPRKAVFGILLSCETQNIRFRLDFKKIYCVFNATQGRYKEIT